MFEMILNTAKFAASKDVRQSAASLIEIIRRSPEWQRDIVNLEAKIARTYAEQATLLSGLTISKMKNLGYVDEGITAFEGSFAELVTNAFEHGTRNDQDIVTIIVQITFQYVVLTVLNPKRQKFDPERIMLNNRRELTLNQFQKRGRGLLAVEEWADEIGSVQDKEGVKTIFYKDRVSFEVKKLKEDLVVLRVSSGLLNPSLKRRLLNQADEYLRYNLILDFRQKLQITKVPLIILELNELYSKSTKRIVALVTKEHRTVWLPDSIIANTEEEATRKIYTPRIEDLKPNIEDIRVANWIREQGDKE